MQIDRTRITQAPEPVLGIDARRQIMMNSMKHDLRTGLFVAPVRPREQHEGRK